MAGKELSLNKPDKKSKSLLIAVCSQQLQGSLVGLLTGSIMNMINITAVTMNIVDNKVHGLCT